MSKHTGGRQPCSDGLAYNFTFRVGVEALKELGRIAELRGQTKGELFRELLYDFLETEEEKAKHERFRQADRSRLCPVRHSDGPGVLGDS